jgi:photosystem II stability/assembly factor-like uncharacterized protein
MLVLVAALAAAGDVRWHTTGPGGGGSMFHPTVSPHDSRFVVVACDMTGNYLTRDGGESWRFFSLRDPVQFFVFDPMDPRVRYASTGGLYRSTDAGETWQTLLPRPAAIEKKTTGDDHASERIWVKEPPEAGVSALVVDPDDSRSLYAAVDSVLWHSVDTGASWRAIAQLNGRVNGLWIDSRSATGDRTLYAAGPDAIYMRRDGKWSAGQSPGKLKSVSAALPFFYAVADGKIWTSDGGVKWAVAAEISGGAQATFVAAAPGNPAIAYASFEGRTYGVAKTEDHGQHWATLPYNVRDAWLSNRFGAGWAGNPWGIGIAAGDPRICYATDSGRVMRTRDGGRTWAPVYSRRAPDGNWTTNGIDVTTSYGVHFDPFDARRVFVSFTDIGLWASANGGESWYSATRQGVPREWVNTTYWVEFHPTVRGRMWAAMSGTHDLPRDKMWRNRGVETFTGGVMRSDDGGTSWRAQRNGMPETAATHILRDDSGNLYVTGFGRGVFKSSDGGEHWSLKNAGIAGAQPFAWRLAREKTTLYLIVARRSDDVAGALYRSVDGAEHWAPVRLPDGVTGPNGVAVDGDRLYLGSWGRSTPAGAVGGGIWLSANGGASWKQVLTSDQHIYDVTINPRDRNELYAAGFEGNLWHSTDRGVTWQRVPGFDVKWGHRAVFDPGDPKKIWVTTFGIGVWRN